MSSASVQVCERKPTKPSIIVPLPRPVTNEIEATGSRKLPLPVTAVVGDIVKRNILNEMGMTLSDVDPEVIDPSLKKQKIAEMGLTLSDDDSVVIEPSPKKQKTAILIPPHQEPGRCKHRFVKGSSKGLVCNKRCLKGRDKCGIHFGQIVKKNLKTSVASSSVTVSSNVRQSTSQEITTPPVNPSDPQDVSSQRVSALSKTLVETKAKLSTLECILLNLMKNPPKRVTQTEARKTNSSKQRKPGNIQKIRIYKLKQTETYKLVRYEDSMPIVESKGKLYKIPLPAYMDRPSPNGKWSLVCDSTTARMVWKEK